jgi:hypothetical protein
LNMSAREQHELCKYYAAGVNAHKIGEFFKKGWNKFAYPMAKNIPVLAPYATILD